MDKKKKAHPGINQLKDQFKQGNLDRREFLRLATLLGMSAGAAMTFGGVAFPVKAAAADVKRGGVLKIASQVQKLEHPSAISWGVVSNQISQVAEYLTVTDKDNITHPHLLENWQVSDDLKVWTLNLRQGITFNNGDEFTADDVVFTMNQWLNKDVGSSMLGLFGSYVESSGIEKTSQYQVKLHLTRPEIALPEHLYHYPAMIFNHRTFQGDFLKQPHGTGPYTIESYVEGEQCVLKARTDYWQKGADGQPLPYMDGMHFMDMGTDISPAINALKSGQVDMIDLVDSGGANAYQALKDDPNVTAHATPSSFVGLLRMRVDKKPWDNEKVRMALKLCQHRKKLLQLGFFGQGLLGNDFHVFPKHPEYAELPQLNYDPEKAKALLAEAGYPDGVEVIISVGSDWGDTVRYAEILKKDAEPAGFKITIKPMPTSQYWEKWTEVDLGITPWTHRPLGTMVLNLAYVADKDGQPAGWNETRWLDTEFIELLEQANGIYDVDERRKVFAKLEKIQQERGSVGIAYWQNTWIITSKNVQNVQGHPGMYMLFNEVWLNEG